jgi:hypothetical protein
VQVGGELTDPRYGFHVRYDSNLARFTAQHVYDASSGADTIRWLVPNSFDGPDLQGLLAVSGSQWPAGTTAQSVLQDELSGDCPSATQDYVLTSASVGYVPGVGVVESCAIPLGYGVSLPYRCIFDVAIQNSLAITVLVCGVYIHPAVWQKYLNNGHVTIAGIYLANFADFEVNNVTWPSP